MTNENNVKNTVEELKKLLNSQSAIGEPIETEDKIIIPIMRMGFGFSAAEGFGQKLGGNGAAGAAGVEPVSMLDITKGMEGIDGIRVLNLSKGTATNKALTDLGVDSTKIKAVGFGETRPVASNETVEGRAENRRVEAVMVK